MTKSIVRFAVYIRWLEAIAIGAVLCLAGLAPAAQTDPSTGAVTAAVAGSSNEVRQAIQEKGQATVDQLEVMWQRIDEKRLKNRTPDELVAWVIMGLLVSGLLYRFGKRGWLTSIVLGLIGSFVGGIVAHVAQLNFGLGPVLITYEDLICTLAGGLLMLVGVRWALVKKFLKPTP